MDAFIVVALLSVLCGSTDPEKIKRPSVARIMQTTAKLRQRIENSKIELDGQIAFVPEIERINNVLLKSFELNQPCRRKPDHFWCGPLSLLPQEDRGSIRLRSFSATFWRGGSS